MKIFTKPVSKLVLYILVVFIVVNIAATTYLMWPVVEPNTIAFPTITTALQTQTITTTNFPTLIPSSTTTTIPTNTKSPPTITPTLISASLQSLEQNGTMILSLADGEYYHLFAFHPQFLPLTRLTSGASDDIDPAVSPDGTKIAYSSRKNGFWDIYILDLNSEQSLQLTRTLEFEGSPTWSPDGKWLAYETYAKGNFDIFLADVENPEQEPIPLTDDPAADYSPSWMPGETGRQIAFVSDRSGEDEIWIARLDDFNERFVNFSRDSEDKDTSPTWSPDGKSLAWAKKVGSESTLVILDLESDNTVPRTAGLGDLPVWNPKGNSLLSRVAQANLSAIASYDLQTGLIDIPLIRLPGPIQGLDWKTSGLERNLSALSSQNPSTLTSLLWTSQNSDNPITPGLNDLVLLDGVKAPYPVLLKNVVESYNALRSKVANEVGWDFMNTLESAYMEKDLPQYPGMGNSWLNTGRGIAVNQLPLNSGWMTLVREDQGSQTYWRVFLKTREQNGSQGRPMTGKTWDILARNSGDPAVYENGGKVAPVPEGYWVDFTELASRYGWDRIPALSNWITYFPASRFNVFAYTESMDLPTALGQLYPGEDFSRPVIRPTLPPLPTFTPVPSTPTPNPTVENED
jgi:TolB protein